jgi:hypothetical protein
MSTVALLVGGTRSPYECRLGRAPRMGRHSRRGPLLRRRRQRRLLPQWCCGTSLGPERVSTRLTCRTTCARKASCSCCTPRSVGKTSRRNLGAAPEVTCWRRAQRWAHAGVRTGASDRGKPGSTAVAGPCPNVGNEDRMTANPAQIRKFLKGVDYYGEEQTLLRRAEANNADEKAPRRGRCRRRARAWMLVAGQ